MLKQEINQNALHIKIEKDIDFTETKSYNNALTWVLEHRDVKLCILDIADIEKITSRLLATIILFTEDLELKKIDAEIVNISTYNRELFNLIANKVLCKHL